MALPVGSGALDQAENFAHGGRAANDFSDRLAAPQDRFKLHVLLRQLTAVVCLFN
jgi:hypothetical protein